MSYSMWRARRNFNTVLFKRCWSSHKGDRESPLRRLIKDAAAYGEPATPVSESELHWATQPYTDRPELPQRPRVDPEHSTVLLFPGQGSQYVGMGKNLMQLHKSKELYQLASSIVGWDVERLCIEGPEKELSQKCQVAVLVTSLAALELVRDERPGALERVRAAAGFSLGEISALVFARALTFENALRLVQVREAAMRAAAAERPGGMLTVWLAPDANLPHALLRAREHAMRHSLPGAPVCEIANYLYPGCKVIAGDEEALRFVERHGAQFGVRKSARVRVAGAFHSALMSRAAEAVREATRALPMSAPQVRVVSAVDARPLRDAAHVARQLARHVERPLRWEQTLHALYARPQGERFPLTLVLGPGSALRSTLRQVNAKAWDGSLQIDV